MMHQRGSAQRRRDDAGPTSPPIEGVAAERQGQPPHGGEHVDVRATLFFGQRGIAPGQERVPLGTPYADGVWVGCGWRSDHDGDGMTLVACAGIAGDAPEPLGRRSPERSIGRGLRSVVPVHLKHSTDPGRTTAMERSRRRDVVRVMLGGMTALAAIAPRESAAKSRQCLRPSAIAARNASIRAGAETVTVQTGEIEETWAGPAFVDELTRRAVGR